MVGAPFGTKPGYVVGEGVTLGRKARALGARFSLDVSAELTGGEPVVRRANGVVFGITREQQGLRQAARSLDDVFRALNLRAEIASRR